MPIPNTMSAAVVERFREPLVMRELPVPTPGPGQALVEIMASGVCHTDLHAADGDWPVKPNLPITPGHEGAGIVVALGSGVRHLKEGDRVGIAWLHSACGHCDFCLSGWETLCLEQKNSCPRRHSENPHEATQVGMAYLLIWPSVCRQFSGR
jgi:propanol-preferring alcohol dehydrogenase